MKTTLLIIHREYITRIRKPSYWLLTLLIPTLVGGLYLIPPMLATRPAKQAHIMVVDDSGLFVGQLQNTALVSYRPAGGFSYACRQLDEADSIDALLHIPARATTLPTEAFLYYKADAPSAAVQNDVDHQLQTLLRNSILLDVHGITQQDYNMIASTRVHLRTQDLATGREAFIQVKSVVALFLALLAIAVVLLFGGQVLRGVVEERNSRVVEVLLSSVSPFRLMLGKVIGIGLAGLTQFALWVVLSGAAVAGVRTAYAPLFAQVEAAQPTAIATKGAEAAAQMKAAQETVPVPELVEGLASINFATIVPLFALIAILGYLLYATLYAAVGAWGERDTDSSTFAIPLVAPLLLTLLYAPAIIASPSGTLAIVLSVIPFTAPVALLLRLPFGLPVAQLIISTALTVIFIPLCTLAAARIYKRRVLRW